MKRFISLFCVFALLFCLASCSASGECEYENFIKALTDIRDAVPDEDTDEEEALKINDVTACVYGDTDRYYDVTVTDEFISLFSGEYERSTFGGGEKILSVTLSMQYEICFFEGDDAMIYYGFCGVFQKDRQYYSVKLDGGVTALLDYIKNNGTISDIEEEN